MSSSRFDRAATRMDYFADLAENVRLAMAEDLGGGDLTAALIPAGRRARARVIVREAAVVCGTRWFDAVYAAVDPSVQVQWQVEDGAKVEADTVLCEITGSARALVSGEKTLRGPTGRHHNAAAGYPKDHSRPASGAEVCGEMRRRIQPSCGPL